VLSFFLTLLRDLGCLRIMVFGGCADDLRAPPERDNFWMADNPGFSVSAGCHALVPSDEWRVKCME
jgi:hypothetical protein